MAQAEEVTVERLRKKGFVNAETRGRPVILYTEGRFWVLHNGMLILVREVPLKTLLTFRKDLHGCHETVMDTQNLSSNELAMFLLVLSACIEAETMKVGAEQAAATQLAMSAMLDRENDDAAECLVVVSNT